VCWVCIWVDGSLAEKRVGEGLGRGTACVGFEGKETAEEVEKVRVSICGLDNVGEALDAAHGLDRGDRRCTGGPVEGAGRDTCRVDAWA
jgi:hypothetical protein